MSSGTILLLVISAVTLADMLFAMYFRSLADRVESGETVSRNIEPTRARKTATLILINAPIIWVIVALISFGVIPSGIDPVKF
ncbi:MAG TPA: hypothetical protein VFW35_03065 [Sphingomicrobium sp.]|nr:hypothetical protein [Sphingomicrobium sp.]